MTIEGIEYIYDKEDNSHIIDEIEKEEEVDSLIDKYSLEVEIDRKNIHKIIEEDFDY